MTEKTVANNYKVYKITNLINDKKYFGITSQDPENRWNNGNGYKHNFHFYNSIKKYGWENFKKEIIQDDLTCMEAKLLESFNILRNNTTDPKEGYNKAIFDASTGVSTGRFKTVSDKTKKCISVSRTGETLSPKRHKRLIQTHKRFLGNRPIQKFNKKGILLETYKSVGEASRLNDLTKQNISQAALGKQYSAGGFTWKFAETVITPKFFKPEEAGIDYSNIERAILRGVSI